MRKTLVIHFIIFAVGVQTLLASPAALTTYFTTNGEYIKSSYGTVVPPDEIKPYLLKLRQAAASNPEWFKEEYSKASKTDTPLPYDEKLGLSEAEYNEYLTLWNERTFKELKRVDLQLEQKKNGSWFIRATGPGFLIQSLIFSADFQTITSQNGVLKRSADIQETKNSLLGAWSGAEWVLESKGAISVTRENFCIGKQDNKNTGYLIYEMQESSSKGRILYEKQIVIQFPVKK